MRCMQKAAVILPMVGILAASVWFVYYVWASDTGPPMPTSGYVGSDSFAITAKGQSIDQKPGTSVLSFKVNVK